MAAVMSKRIVTREEQKKLFLQIMDEVDDFCRKNDIRYTLSFGTLLGAVRHNGFIPWDDDMDIDMPYPDMIRFKETFRSKDLKYCDVDTWPNYEFPFSRICYLPTYNKKGLIDEDYGINIDVYPVVGCPEKKEDVDKFFADADVLLRRRKKYMRYRNRLIKLLPIHTIPGFKKAVSTYRDFVLQYPYENAKRYFQMGGYLKWYEVFDYDIFENVIDAEFEGRRFMITAKYDAYLKQTYGDYMTLPPEEKRVPVHGGNYYWR